jgi:serine/threonine protein kinase
MAVTRVSLTGLPPLQRRMVEAWLTRFEENWHENKLSECLRAVPPQSSVRRPLLLAMIERDLAHQWSHGREMTLDDYVRDYPEIGRAEDLPVELIASEFEIRHRYGPVELGEYERRFPRQFDDLQMHLAPMLERAIDRNFEGPDPDLSPAEMRRDLLAVTNGEQAGDPMLERRLQLLKAQPGLNSTVNLPALSGLPSCRMERTVEEVDRFLPAESSRTEPTQPLLHSPAQTIWLEGEAVRDTDNGMTTQQIPTATPKLPIPPQLGRYQIEKVLGRSGRGWTYAAVDTELGRHVAIKVPCFQGADAEIERERFRREARIATTLTHPLLCPILDVGQAEGFDYLVMPLVMGDSLSEVMQARPIWSPRAAVELFYKLASAMDAAHRQGVIHRDLKPSNILLTPSEVPVIVGFGQAKVRVTRSERDGSLYQAPECWQDPSDDANPRIDIYSLGAMLYEVLTGQKPPHPLDPPTPLTFPQDLDAALQSICQRAMSRQPDLRHTSMRELAQELGRLRESLRPSHAASRLSLSAPSSTASVGKLTTSALDRKASLASETAPSVGTVVAPLSASASQVQQIRQLSTQEIPAVHSRPSPAPRRRIAWEWVISAGICIAILAATIFFRNRQAKDSSPTPSTESTPQAANPTPNSPPTSAQDLIEQIGLAGPLERPRLVKALRDSKDPNLVPALIDYLVAAPWRDSNPKGEDRDAVLSVLLQVDPLVVPDMLKRAAKAEQPAVRRWAYSEIGHRIDLDTRPRLLPVLLAGLKDTDGAVRRVAAEQVRRLPPPHEASIAQALFDRVTDALWGDSDSSAPDGGKDAALEALEEFAPQRVMAALNAAERCNHPEVRRWAVMQKSRRTP